MVDAELLDEDFAGPFPTLTILGGEGLSEGVPSDFSSGDSISDAELGNGGEADGRTGPSSSASPRSRISRVTKTSDNGSKAREATSRPPSLDEWANFFSRIVLKTVCAWYLSYAFRGVDEDSLSEREIERLAMTDEERKLISTPLAELSNKSKFMRKHGRTIVASGDAFQAMVVFGAWFSRVNRIAAKYRPKNPRMTINGMAQNGSSGQSPTPTAANGFTTGTSNGRIPDGFPIYQPGTG